jgi:hypothetical protein
MKRNRGDHGGLRAAAALWLLGAPLLVILLGYAFC